MRPWFAAAILAALIISITAASQAGTDTPRGLLVTVPAFHSRYLSRDRDLRIWLPPGYDRERRRRYPVLYLHDGQNVFEGGPSFIPGQAWNADAIALELIQSGRIPPLIIVGIDNTGRERIAEYTPTPLSRYPGSGSGALYARMLVEELKPYIDSHYRTLKDAANTGLGGSSLGGLISLYTGLLYPNAFGKLAVLSPSAWWDDAYIAQQVETLRARPKLKVWLDIGTAEGDDAVAPTRRLQSALVRRGWREGRDLEYVEAAGAEHNERAWAARLPGVLAFLFGSSRNSRHAHNTPVTGGD